MVLTCNVNHLIDWWFWFGYSYAMQLSHYLLLDRIRLIDIRLKLYFGENIFTLLTFYEWSLDSIVIWYNFISISSSQVNELYVELDRRSPTAGLPSATVSDQMVEIAETARFDDFLLESNENLSVTGKKLESGEIVPIQVETIGGDTDNVDVEQAPVNLSSFASEVPGEIVQISLDENEIRDLGIQAANNDENTVVEFSDAPLIGAPFRLISFVAKYVSGADLIDKNSSH